MPYGLRKKRKEDRVTWETRLSPTLSWPGPPSRRLRLHAWEEGRDLYFDIVGSSPLAVANMQHFCAGWGCCTRRSDNKQTRYAVLLSHQQPPVAFQAFSFETFGGLHADVLALLQRLQGLLNQAIIAQERCGWTFCYYVGSVSYCGRCESQLAARRV
eukprot:jgi/Botrbrau1/16159/Bobra.0309s0008.1